MTRFARATGDMHSLSAVDVKLVALAYTLEAAAYGTTHLRVHLLAAALSPHTSAVWATLLLIGMPPR